MQSFPLARTLPAAVRRVTARLDFHALRRKSCNRHGNEEPKTRPAAPDVGPLVPCASAKHSGERARWLARRALRNKARTPIGSAPTRSATWVSAQPQLFSADPQDSHLGQHQLDRRRQLHATRSLIFSLSRRSLAASGFCRSLAPAKQSRPPAPSAPHT
jgi:hypothetical protein